MYLLGLVGNKSVLQSSLMAVAKVCPEIIIRTTGSGPVTASLWIGTCLWGSSQATWFRVRVSGISSS